MPTPLRPSGDPASRRIPFYDLSRKEHRGKGIERAKRSPVMCFYSHGNNIGNFTPNFGMRRMLGIDFDYWSMHRGEPDFDAINTHYRAIVIGGAGLLHGVFEPFWKLIADKCRLPIAIWGVGACAPEGSTRPVDPAVVESLKDRTALVNVRDELTRSMYGFPQGSIAACPTIVWLHGMPREQPRHILLAEHGGIVDPQTLEQIRAAVHAAADAGRTMVRTTENRQRFKWPRTSSSTAHVRRDYARASLVVTSRLHGAIIAYGLGVPYIAFSRDPKIEGFVERFGNGVVVRDIDQLNNALASPPVADQPIRVRECLEFGDRAASWLEGLGVELSATRFSAATLAAR